MLRSGSDGKGEWNDMVRACFEKSFGVCSEGLEEARTTKEGTTIIITKNTVAAII